MTEERNIGAIGYRTGGYSGNVRHQEIKVYPSHNHWIKNNEKWIKSEDVCTSCSNIVYKDFRSTTVKKAIEREIVDRVSSKIKKTQLPVNKDIEDILELFGISSKSSIIPDLTTLFIKPKAHPDADKGYRNIIARNIKIAPSFSKREIDENDKPNFKVVTNEIREEYIKIDGNPKSYRLTQGMSDLSARKNSYL